MFGMHMPIYRFEAKVEGRQGANFSHLPFDQDKRITPRLGWRVLLGVSSDCEDKLGSPESFNGDSW